MSVRRGGSGAQLTRWKRQYPSWVHSPLCRWDKQFLRFARFPREGASHRARLAVAYGILLTLGFFAKLQMLPQQAGLAALALAVSAGTSRAMWKSAYRPDFHPAQPPRKAACQPYLAAHRFVPDWSPDAE